MKNPKWLGLILLTFLSLYPTNTVQAVTNELQFRYVISTDSSELQQLRGLSRWLNQKGFDVAGLDLRRGQIEVITTQSGIDYLSRQGLRGNIKAARTPGSEAMRPDPRYLNPESLTQKLQAISQQFPQLTRLEQIGTSNQGRPVWALLVSTTPMDKDPRAFEKPTVIFDGLHHAREVMTPEIVVDVAETILSEVSQSPKLQKLIDRWNIWLVPMLNVDGSNIVFKEDNWWRKNAWAEGGSIYGVDINRNYSFKWNSCRGSSGSKSSDIYRGKMPGSEPETQALMNLALRVRPTASISYHSFSELVLYPFGCSGQYPAEKILFQRLAMELSKRLPSDDGGGFYTPGAPWELLYDVDGSSMDFMHGVFGALAFTFEVNQDFQPPYELREPTLRKHRLAWAYFWNRMDRNLLSVTVIDGVTQMPAMAEIDLNVVLTENGATPFKTNIAGRFFKVLDPGRYAIRARLPDGRSQDQTFEMNGSQKMTVVVP